jgi:adenosine deaminase
LIAGAALAGPERGHPIKPHRKTLARLREAGLRIEIHAGEWCGPESVWEALEYGRPDRIGHGISIFQDPALLDRVRERGIHVEMCPTSNLITGSVSRIEAHPIARARELDLSFSVNTDDPGPFGCSMTSEYELLARVFGFTDGDFQKIYDNSLQARFQPALRRQPWVS